MNPNLLFAIGTLLTWIGWVFAARAIVVFIQILMGQAPEARQDAIKSGTITAVIAAAMLGVAAVLPMSVGRQIDPGISMPIVWFVMPFTGWIAALAVIVIPLRLIQAGLAADSVERMDRYKAVGAWFIALIAFVFLTLRDKDNKVEIIRGAIPLGAGLVAAIVLLSVVGVVSMVFASRWAASRGVAKTLASQTALIAGSIVFGLPFAFLLITSFKEDRDMSSPQGIVWVPKVQETVPYMDPEHPRFEVQHDGQRIVATIMKEEKAGTVEVEVQEPRAIQGTTFETPKSALKEIPRQANVVTGDFDGKTIKGVVIEDLEDGSQKVKVISPPELKDKVKVYGPGVAEPLRHPGLRWQNYTEAISFLPPETNNGLVYIKNTLIIVIFSVIGTIMSSSIVAYAFSRMKFPGRDALFAVLLTTMMLPGAVTMLPQFLIFRSFGWIDTLYPLWVPAFFASAFNVFLLRQFFKQIPMELEDASKIDGASYLKTFWSVMLPQIKPALAVIAIWTFMGAWNNFMGPLIYINSPEKMPLSYALQLFMSDRGGEPGMLMAFATMTIIPVLLLFFFAQRYFIEGVTLSGLGGR